MSTELVELRSFYREPGFLLLAHESGEPAGCVGVRTLTSSSGEVRRLFVRPEFRGLGLGRRLLQNATDHARQQGFTRLMLNTLPTMVEAQALYDAAGYQPIEPYVAEPVEGVQYLGRTL